MLAFLKAEGLLSVEHERLLLSWQHATGFSVDASVKVEPEDFAGLERMRWDPESDEVAYRRKTRDGQPGAVELLDPLDWLARCARGDSPPPEGGRRPPFPHSGSAAPSLRPPRPRPRAAADGEFLARVIAHIPQPRLHTVRYMGHYSNVSRGRRLKGRDATLDTTSARDEPDDMTSAKRRARRRAWARLLRTVYEISPLSCPKCGTEMKIISVVLDPAIITNSSTTSARRRRPTPGPRQTRRARSKPHPDPFAQAQAQDLPTARPPRSLPGPGECVGGFLDHRAPSPGRPPRASSPLPGPPGYRAPVHAGGRLEPWESKSLSLIVCSKWVPAHALAPAMNEPLREPAEILAEIHRIEGFVQAMRKRGRS